MTPRPPADPRRSSSPDLTLSDDARVLEHGLAESLARRADPLEPVLVVAPTRRLLDHLCRRLTPRGGALAGVHFHHHRSLARALLQGAGQPIPLALPDTWRRMLLEDTLRADGSDLERYLLRQPAAQRALDATFQDLRDSGWEADTRPTGAWSEDGRMTLDLFQRYSERLREREAEGFGDGATLVRAAICSLHGTPPPFHTVHHHGAYELIGVHRQLLQAMSEHRHTSWWIPASAACADPAPPGPLCRRLGQPGLTPSTASMGPERWTEVSLPDPRAEVRRALRQLLSWHQRDAVPYEDMALLVRSGGAYVTLLESEAARLGIRTDCSWRRPVGGLPEAAAARLLLEWLEAPKDAERLGRFERVADRYFPRFDDQSDLLRRWLAVREWPSALSLLQDRVAAAWPECLRQDLEELRVTADRLSLPSGEQVPTLVAATLLETLAHTLLPPATSDSPLRVLDLPQARGIPLRRAVWMGAHEGLLPRQARPDPFLPDEDRRRLAEITGLEIPVKEQGEQEEDLLWHLQRANVSEELQYTWPREDLGGRELARSPFLERLEKPSAEHRVAAHPRSELEDLHTSHGLLLPQEAVELCALSSPAPAKDVATLARDLDFAPWRWSEGLQWQGAVEDFRHLQPGIDGSLGPVGERRWSAKSLRMLGQCPLQFAFHYRLGLRAPEEADETSDYTALELGILVHSFLCLLYRELFPTEQPVTDPAALWERARDRWPDLWKQAHAQAVPPSRVIPKAVRKAREEAHRQALLAFLEGDLEHLSTTRLGLRACEWKLEGTVSVAGEMLPVEGSIDRILVDEQGGEILGDYKSSRPSSLKIQASATAAIRAEEPQLPFYWLSRLALEQRVVGLELIGVGPKARGRRPGLQASPYARLDLDKLSANRQEFEQRIRTLLEVARDGWYPLVASITHPGNHSACSTCDFLRACRPHHLPSARRVEDAERFAAFFGKEASS